MIVPNPIARCRRPTAAIQLLLTAALLAGATVIPPADGPMLLVPAMGTRPGPALTLAIARGASVLGSGPAGSIVIRGERRLLFAPLLSHGVLLIAAPRRWCGA